MTPERLKQITSRYGKLTVVVVGDVCLDRYLHIDPSLAEISLETRLPVYNVVAVRPQPGGAGTILANVVALGPAATRVVGFCGDDGEGFELRRALASMGVDMSGFFIAPGRLTFTYTKPLLIHPNRPPQELNRLDIRTRTPTDRRLQQQVISHLREAVVGADVIIALEQVPQPETGVLTRRVKQVLAELAEKYPEKIFLADSRCATGDFAGVRIKVNRSELLSHFAAPDDADLPALALRWAAQLGRDVFVTLGAEGIMVASAGRVHHVGGIAVAGPIDVVGAGDAATANIALALGAGADAFEAGEIGNLAGSIVVKKIGTTGTATVAELADALQRAGHTA